MRRQVPIAGSDELGRSRQEFNQLGVTFIELLITIVIVGILAAIAVPYYGDYIARQRLVGAAEAIYGQMQLAKRASISNNKTIYFLAAGTGTTNWCATFSESPTIDSECSNGWILSSSANPSVRVRAEDFPNVTLTDFTSGAETIGFQMPGVSLDSPETLELSVGSTSLGNLRVRATSPMQISICTTNGLGSYVDC